MKRLVLIIIVLLAIFSVIRAYTQDTAARGPGIGLSPGLIEVESGNGTLGISFGLLESVAGGAGNMLPLRIVYSDGSTNLSIGLNGLSLLLGGANVGRPVSIDSPRAGNVLSVGGVVTVDSRVTGDVWAFGSDIILLSNADVSGNVVAIGGRVRADPRAQWRGTVSSLPRLRLPFLGTLGSGPSAVAVELAREALLFLLAALLLFLGSFFLTPQFAGIARSSTRLWRQTLVIAALGVLVVPASVILLIVSVLGVFFLPFLILAVLLVAFAGYFALAARLGAGLRRGSAGSAIFLFTSGLLGLFILKAPALAGIVLTLVNSNVAGAAGQVLRMVSLWATLVFLVCGFGASRAHARAAVAAKAS